MISRPLARQRRKRQPSSTAAAPSVAERLAHVSALLDEGNAEAAADACRQLPSDAPEISETLCRLGFLLIERQRLEEANGVFLRAARANPSLSWSFLGIADACELQGRPWDALVALEAARSRDPGLERFDARIEELRLLSLGTPAPRILVADGVEDENGRALLLISALHIAAPKLGRTLVRFLDVETDAVRAAAEMLAWDCGIEVECLQVDQPHATAFQGATGFAAVAFRSCARIEVLARQADSIGLPALVAEQFPDSHAPAGRILLSKASHDPALLATQLCSMLECR